MWAPTRGHGAVWVLAMAAATAWALVLPPTADLAAQAYRTGLVERHGFVVWDNAWFGGHTMPGYSLLSPALGAALGLGGLGLLCVGITVAAFSGLIRTSRTRRSVGALAWVACASVADLLIGRLTYALGVALGLVTLWALRRGLGWGWIVLGSLATAAASPVAGLFLLLVAAALWEPHPAAPPTCAAPPAPTAPPTCAALPAPTAPPTCAALPAPAAPPTCAAPPAPAAPPTCAAPPAQPVHAGSFARRAPGRLRARLRSAAPVVALAAPALAVLGASAVLFPERGAQPFAIGPALVAFAAGAAVALCAPAGPLRRGAALYAAAVVAALVLPTPLGSNVSRLGVTFAAPLVLLLTPRLTVPTWRARVVVLAALAVWLAWAPVTELRKAAADPAPRRADYAAVLNELAHRGAAAGRVEVVPSATRWESVYVARRFALARGWLTQLDRRRDGLFYAETLDPAAYVAWLRRNAVRFVVRKDGATEHWGRTEAALLDRGVPGLRPVWRRGPWRIWAVQDPRALAPGAGDVHLGSQELALTTRRPSVSILALRWTTWSVRGPACVSRTPGGRTRLVVWAPGHVELRPALALPSDATHCGR